MTGSPQPSLPPGYVQLTAGRIRTTDLVFGKASVVWSQPHAFVVGSEVGHDGTQVARRVAVERGTRVRS
jgi:hypothetical protein